MQYGYIKLKELSRESWVGLKVRKVLKHRPKYATSIATIFIVAATAFLYRLKASTILTLMHEDL